MRKRIAAVSTTCGLEMDTMDEGRLKPIEICEAFTKMNRAQGRNSRRFPQRAARSGNCDHLKNTPMLPAAPIASVSRRRADYCRLLSRNGHRSTRLEMLI